MWRADIEVVSLAVHVNSRARPRCYPRGSFYPTSHGPSTRYRGITKPDFHPCSACLPRSQAPLCLCTRRVVAIHPEETFGRLHCLLGGDCTSQTAHQALSTRRTCAAGVRARAPLGWYFNVGSARAGALVSQPPTYATQTELQPNTKLQSSSTGSFRPAAGKTHLHAYFSFAGSLIETVPCSLHRSCTTVFSRQGTSLP